MNLFRRALLAVKRRKRISRRMLAALFAVELILMTGANILIGIEDFKSALRETGCTGFQVTEELDPQTVEALAETEGVTAYDTTYVLSALYSDEVFLFPGLYDWIIKNTDYQKYYDSEYERRQDYLGTCMPYYHAHRNTIFAPAFQSGQFELVEGRHITAADKNAVLISDAVAAHNGLSVGDCYTVHYDATAYNSLFPEWAGFECTLTVTGIYHGEIDASGTDHMIEQSIPINTFFLDINTAVEFFDYAGWEIEYDSAAFYTETPAALGDAMERARTREDIAWQKYQMRYEDSAYRFVLEPLDTLKVVVWLLLTVLACGSFGVQTQLMRCSLKERLWELRGFRRLGFARRTVIVQHALEYALLALIAALPAALISAVIAEPLGNLSGRTVQFAAGPSPVAACGSVAVVLAALLLTLRYQVRYSFAFAEWDR